MRKAKSLIQEFVSQILFMNVADLDHGGCPRPCTIVEYETQMVTTAK